MLILCSNGLSSNKIVTSLQEKFKGLKTSALVVTADNEYKENNYHVDRCIEELKSLNLSVDIFDIDSKNPKLLLKYDVVEFIGGNPFYLLNSIRIHKVENVLKQLAKEKILIGWSASAFVFSPSLELVNKYSPELNFLNLKDLNGLSLTSLEVLPHYSKFIDRFDNFEEICSTYEKDKNIKVIRLNDGDAIFIDGNNVKIV